MAQEIDRTVELSINGMTCGHCVASVTEELSEVPRRPERRGHPQLRRNLQGHRCHQHRTR